MNSLWRGLTLIATLTLSACAKGPHGLPYNAWYIGALAPPYMDVWIETVDVADARGQVYKRVVSGVASMSSPPKLDVDPRGWARTPGWGAGKHVLGADLPLWIYVRWQSLVEPHTYEAFIRVDAAMRKAMVTDKKAFCAADGEWITDYPYAVNIGLAPGGIARVWIAGQCTRSVPIARVQGRVVEAGTYGGQYGNAYPELDDVSKAYVEKYGVPYGSW